MSTLYPIAVVLALGLAVWLQRSVPMPRGYVWLSWGASAVSAALLAPTVLRQPSVETLSEAALFAALPLIAVPYQVRMMRWISGTKDERGGAPGERPRGPGGGRVRARDRRR